MGSQDSGTDHCEDSFRDSLGKSFRNRTTMKVTCAHIS